MNGFERASIEMSLEHLESVKPYVAGYQKFAAKAMRGYYDELVQNGFSDDQALTIVTAQGFFPIGKKL